MKITFDQIRDCIADRPIWSHVFTVIEIIEAKAKEEPAYADIVDQWLTGQRSTVWLRDEIMEPLRQNEILVSIGRKFNPSTEWDNTWMPLDSAIHCVKHNIKLS